MDIAGSFGGESVDRNGCSILDSKLGPINVMVRGGNGRKGLPETTKIASAVSKGRDARSFKSRHQYLIEFDRTKVLPVSIGATQDIPTMGAESMREETWMMESTLMDCKQSKSRNTGSRCI